MLHLHSKKALNTFVQGFNVLSIYSSCHPCLCGDPNTTVGNHTTMGRYQTLGSDTGNANK